METMSPDIQTLRNQLLETMSPQALPADEVARLVALMRELSLGRPVSRVRLCELWCLAPDEAIRQKILVDNPQALYGF